MHLDMCSHDNYPGHCPHCRIKDLEEETRSLREKLKEAEQKSKDYVLAVRVAQDVVKELQEKLKEADDLLIQATDHVPEELERKIWEFLGQPIAEEGGPARG